MFLTRKHSPRVGLCDVGIQSQETRQHKPHDRQRLDVPAHNLSGVFGISFHLPYSNPNKEDTNHCPHLTLFHNVGLVVCNPPRGSTCNSVWATSAFILTMIDDRFLIVPESIFQTLIGGNFLSNDRSNYLKLLISIYSARMHHSSPPACSTWSCTTKPRHLFLKQEPRCPRLWRIAGEKMADTAGRSNKVGLALHAA